MNCHTHPKAVCCRRGGSPKLVRRTKRGNNNVPPPHPPSPTHRLISTARISRKRRRRRPTERRRNRRVRRRSRWTRRDVNIAKNTRATSGIIHLPKAPHTPNVTITQGTRVGGQIWYTQKSVSITRHMMSVRETEIDGVGAQTRK